jgi:hypothetical protein
LANDLCKSLMVRQCGGKGLSPMYHLVVMQQPFVVEL